MDFPYNTWRLQELNCKLDRNRLPRLRTYLLPDSAINISLGDLSIAGFSARLPRPWVRSVVDHRQLRGGELRVALGGGEALVAQ